MQLGTRWAAGALPHRSVPALLHDAIAEQEAAHPTGTAWTLTWLEGRPRLDLDGLVLVTLDAHGEVSVRQPEDTGAAPPVTPENANSAENPDIAEYDEDEDDWLRG